MVLISLEFRRLVSSHTKFNLGIDHSILLDVGKGLGEKLALGELY